MQARTTKSAAYDDEEFVHALTQFKAMFGGAFKKSVPKQKTLLLLRNEEGRFTALYDPTGRNDGGFGGVKDEDKAQKLGDVVDPRIAKAMWLTYLAGPKPASPPAKESIVAGLAVA